MVRIVLAIVASLALLGVLSLLIMESSTVNEAYYATHAERVRAIESTRDDLEAIVSAADSAYQDGRRFPANLNTATTRLLQANALLQAARPVDDLDSVLGTRLTLYDGAVNKFIADADDFVTRQNAMADSLRLVQEESPTVVKDLRRFDLRLQSQTTFSLAIDIIEFASGQNRANPANLKSRVEALSNDPAVNDRAPGRVDTFVSAASNLIEQHGEAGTALEQLNRNRVTDELWSLSDAVQAENRRTVGRAERARLLLSVCTLLLLVGIGFVVYRLQTSYRALNRSNAELETMNNSLEERVNVRTEELSSAYDDLKESQVQLVQAEKMSSLGELVAGISHEINTPLWYLINNATIIQERLESMGQLTATAETMISSVRSGTDVKQNLQRGLKDMQKMLSDGLKDDIEEANDLVRDSIEGLEDLTELAQSLKDFSRLDRAQQGQFDVNDGIAKTLLIVKNKLKAKVTVHKHLGDVPEIHCSPSQINQVFLNLITNAADAIDDQGEVLIRSWTENDQVSVSIADTGCGIPDDVMDKIRDPFFTTKSVGKGTGLGLSIVDRIIESHGGELKIESEVGKGTVITVTLPIGVSGEATLTAESTADANLSEVELETETNFAAMSEHSDVQPERAETEVAASAATA